MNSPFHWLHKGLDIENSKFNGYNLLLIFIFYILLTALFFFFFFLAKPLFVSFITSRIPAQQQQQHQCGPPNVGLDLGTIASLPVCSPHSSATSAAECSICLGEFQEEEKVKVLPECLHVFHPECVDVWLTTHSSCPFCRASLRVFAKPADSAA